MADRCPWCGAEELGSAAWKCYTVKGALGMHRTSNCRAIESKNLRARVARLEAALQRIARYSPGTVGQMASEALRADA